jgi:hypothetical protein
VLGYESVSSSVDRYVHMTTPAEPVCSIDSVQADARRGTARAGSYDASRGLTTTDRERNCPGRAKVAERPESWNPRQSGVHLEE